MKPQMRPRLAAALMSGLAGVMAFCATARAVERQTLPGHAPGAVARLNLQPVGRLPATNRLNLAIGLPLRNTNELARLLEDLYDPASPQFRHYLTPEQFAEEFGPTKEDYQAVMDFAKQRGLAIAGTHPNRTILDVSGQTADLERALHVTMRTYEHPREARQFYAPDTDPSFDLAVPLLHLSGLDNYAPPRPRAQAAPLGRNGGLGTANGSGPDGLYTSKDLRAAYVPGVALTGTGQSVGLFEMDSYDPHDVEAYATLAGLPSVTPSNVQVDGVAIAPGLWAVEVNLDIDMAIAMASGLSQVIVYQGLRNPNDILNRMATDNLARQLSSSWFWGPALDPIAHQIFQQMAAQGQSMFQCAGDAGAWVTAAEPVAPMDDPYVTLAGGTSLTMTGNGGAYASETVWNSGAQAGSGGTSIQYPIPSWQQGINMTSNGGSTTMRNMPDVAMVADNLQIWLDGQWGGSGGTSAAAPLWAAFAALVNQAAQADGQPPAGFLNPALYSLGRSAAYQTLFHDIVTGNSETSASPEQYKALPGYDLCTGWGSPRAALIDALAFPEPLRIAPAFALVFTGPAGGPFSPAIQTCTLTNKGTDSLDWTVATDVPWLSLEPSAGTLAAGATTNVALQLSTQAGALIAGTYSGTLFFTNSSDQALQRRQVSLAIVTAPTITSQPTNQAVLAGANVSFVVGTATNALLQYQWQCNNGSYTTNLADGGSVSGSATPTLSIGSVSPADAGAYSVVISNGAGSLTSAVATLQLVPSAPVIVTQPAGTTVLPGATVTLNVIAVGDQPLVYSWQVPGMTGQPAVGLSGLAGSALTISNATQASAGAYTVVISNGLGVVTSAVAVLSLTGTSAPGVALDALYSFPADGSLGAYPYAGLLQAAYGTFYGTALQGGASGFGTVFRMDTNGLVSLAHSFAGSEGAFPYGGLIQGTNGLLYGTTYIQFPSAGGYNYGSIYRMNTNGAIVQLATFNGNNFATVGTFPFAGMVQGRDGSFYGTSFYDGVSGNGAVYRVTPNGTITGLGSLNNTDGANPSSSPLQGADGAFYGTAQNGGTNGGWGTVFKVTSSGQVTALVSFANTNGAQPIAGLAQDADGAFYGTTYAGGAAGAGTLFKLAADGTFSSLYSFSGGTDGANPYGGLCLASDGNLYGATEKGGAYGLGAVFRLTPSGAVTTLVQFDGYQGANPEGTLIQGTDGALYGTTRNGGAANKGAVLRLSLGGALQITAQPQSKTAFPGDTVLFSVATSGGLPMSYQWRKAGMALSDGGNASGSSTRVLVLTNVTGTDIAAYSVVVSNSYGALTSAEASLQVNVSAPQIVGGPVSQTVLAGTTVTLTVEAAGDSPLSFQWQRLATNLVDGGKILGSATSTLTLTSVSPSNAGAYSVVVSNAVGTVSSSSAALTVVPAVAPGVALTTLHALSYNDDRGHGAVNPYAGVIQGKDGNFYGTTLNGGEYGTGAIFKLSPSGTINNLSSFAAVNAYFGVLPLASLIEGNDGNFYGAAFSGGIGGAGPSDGAGTIFRTTPSGILAPVHIFGTYSPGDDGSGPAAALILGSDGAFYGTTEFGGNSTNIIAVNGINEGGYGTIFKITTNGALTTLFTFNSTNGAFPVAPLLLGGDHNFYGTTLMGGSNNSPWSGLMDPTGLALNPPSSRPGTAISMARQSLEARLTMAAPATAMGWSFDSRCRCS
jgi:uncharacterized repeat protein (TIGR03803 family)